MNERTIAHGHAMPACAQLSRTALTPQLASTGFNNQPTAQLVMLRNTVVVISYKTI